MPVPLTVGVKLNEPVAQVAVVLPQHLVCSADTWTKLRQKLLGEKRARTVTNRGRLSEDLVIRLSTIYTLTIYTDTTTYPEGGLEGCLTNSNFKQQAFQINKAVQKTK